VRTEARWVVLGGLGSIGKRHVANLRTLGIEPLIVDPAGGATVYEPLPSDRVVIASPSRFHEEQLAALGPRVHAILVEKPPALTGAGWREVRDACPRLAVGFNWRFHPIVKMFKGGDFEGVEIISFENARLFPGAAHLTDRAQGGGIVLTSAVHSIDLLCHLMGGPAELEEGQAAENQLFARLRHARGLSSVTMVWDWLGKECRRVIFYSSSSPSGVMAFLGLPCNMYLDMMRAFVEYADTGNPGDLCTAEQAQWVMDIADAF